MGPALYLIDGSGFWRKMRKTLGSKRKELAEDQIAELVRLFGASRLKVLTKIVLPGSVPTMISTLKVNVGLALVGVVVGEFQAAKAGLGFLIVYGSQIFQMNLVMTAIVVLAGISSLLFVAIGPSARRRFRRRPRADAEPAPTEPIPDGIAAVEEVGV